MSNERKLFEVNKKMSCGCGEKAVTWLDDGTPLCRECGLDQVLTLLNCGQPVTLKAPGQQDRVITPRNNYRNQN